jgi:predicted metal-binding membrane protein
MLSRRDRVLITTCIGLVTLIAWGYLVRLDRQTSSSMAYDTMMAAMGMASNTPWNAADVFFTFTMWAVMMIGMMTGTAAPVLLVFARKQAGQRGRAIPFTVLMFGAGYLAVWFGFSACATFAQGVLHEAALLTPAMASSNSYLSAAILIAGGLYQLTPFKNACLTHCRSPLIFLMAHWRSGPLGAFQMGLRHGLTCLGCCWALMCVLFVAGVMNLLWVAVLTGVVLAEKIGPGGIITSRVAGAAMIAFGILVAVR